MLTCCKQSLQKNFVSAKSIERTWAARETNHHAVHAFLKRYICTVYKYMYIWIFLCNLIFKISIYLYRIHLSNKTYGMSLHIYPSKNPEVSVKMPNMDGMSMPNMDALGIEHLPSTFISFQKANLKISDAKNTWSTRVAIFIWTIICPNISTMEQINIEKIPSQQQPH